MSKLWPYESWYVFRQSRSSVHCQNKRSATYLNFIVEVKVFGESKKHLRIRYNQVFQEFNQDMDVINGLPERFKIPIVEEIKRVINKHKPKEENK